MEGATAPMVPHYVPYPLEDAIWKGAQRVEPSRYECGHCDSRVGPDTGWELLDPTGGKPLAKILICSYCNKPTYLERASGRQVPGTLFGEAVSYLPDNVQTLYDEVRRGMSIGAYTASVLACRSLIMYVAVEKNAGTDSTFKYYVNYLADEGYVTRESKPWVDKIRDEGGRAAHDIEPFTKDYAEEIVTFVEMLLKLIYEYPRRGQGP